MKKLSIDWEDQRNKRLFVIGTTVLLITGTIFLTSYRNRKAEIKSIWDEISAECLEIEPPVYCKCFTAELQNQYGENDQALLRAVRENQAVERAHLKCVDAK